MKLALIRIQLRNIFVLALAAGIGFVYPVHVVVDHSGLFYHYAHHHNDPYSGDPEPDEDLCAICLTLNSMEASEGHSPVLEHDEEINYALKNGVLGSVVINGKSARAPPVNS